MNVARLLLQITAEVEVCTKCRLAQTRTYAVPGVGTTEARIMFVGEGPGEQEDLTGEPFVGKSGQLLTRELQKIGISRDAVFITNIVKCRPPQNRTPLTDEIEACNDWLGAQIALVEPKFIVPVGGPSLQTLVSKNLRITRARSTVYRKEGILFIPILHPSAALRAPDTMKMFLEDIANLKDFLNREIGEEEINDIGPPIRSRVTSPAEIAITEEQDGNLSLF
ncbi:uracil-DNA glycosylase [bacterium]|nr:MAG: uracil-DNA glycosylase [bacterium]